jgi:hypothetical protein
VPLRSGTVGCSTVRSDDARRCGAVGWVIEEHAFRIHASSRPLWPLAVGVRLLVVLGLLTLAWQAGVFRPVHDLFRGSEGASDATHRAPPSMTPRRWLHVGIVAFVMAESLVWFFAGSIWWSFRGSLVWPGQEPSPSRIARDTYLAIAFFIVAAINVSVLLPFLVRPGRRSIFSVIAIQATGGVGALVLTLVIDTAWIVIAALAVPTLAMLYIAYRRQSATTFQPTIQS